ncbi:MAG TPA: ABC transporter substrate-binding protein [Oligoflexia bacterium]|nr:ABC transporter substrate-binding protein [Oligoflexia bacterium]
MRVLLTGFLFFSLLSHFSAAFARTHDAIKQSGVLRVAVDGMTPPFNYYKGKELSGFEIDLVNEMAKRLGVKVEWSVQTFNTLLVGLGQDRFDLIASSHAITPERQKVADFAEPHYCTGAVLVTKSGGPKTKSDLVGKVGVVPVGTVYYNALKNVPGIKEVRTVPSETDGLQTLLNGRADVWVTDQFVAMDVVKKHQKESLTVGESIMDQQNAMVVAKGNDSLRNAINVIERNMMKDGFYKKLSMSYFGRDIRCK